MRSQLRAELARSGAPPAGDDLAAVRPMKPETRERPFSHPGWAFELKYDGYRVLAAGGAGEARLTYKSGLDATRILPELARAVAGLPISGLLLDGEAVVLDAEGRPDFQRLQRRGMRTRSVDAERAAAESPVAYFVFDLLACEGYDLRPLPLASRKALLRRVLEAAPAGGGPLRLSEEIAERGEDLFAAVVGLGLEGIVAKRLDSPYRSGYAPEWLKVRVDRSSDFAVVGFEPTPGTRTGLRNLHLAVCGPEGALAYAGTVGTGFDRETEAEIRARLEPSRRATPPLAGVKATRNAVWVTPEVVVEVRYKEWTEGGSLRHPVFLRLRDDKRAAECFRPGEEREEEPADTPEAAAPWAGAPLSNPGKVFWPDDGYTKGDLADYYATVAPWMLPYLRDRPLLVDRYPDGVTGKSFYQKSASCEDAESLLALVNLGAVPFHVAASRGAAPERPDWCILDLDPKTAPFAHVVEIALAIRELCAEIEIASYPKTSGGSGLHVLLPLGGLFDHEQSRQLAELLARVVVARLPAIATTLRSIPARRGRVYVDALQNGRGKLLAAAYSVRPRPGATVSTPLDWDEVDGRLDPRAFHLKSVPARLAARGDDPLLPVLTAVPDLARTLDLLSGLL